MASPKYIENVPLKTIVSAIGSPTHKLAKFIVKIISPISGNSKSYVKISTHFVDIINDPEINLCRLIYKSPHCPNRQHSEEDNKLDERTIFSPNDLCDLVELCVKFTYFCYQDQFYEQIEGVSMGSPLSPILANIFMENLEDNAISTFPFQPSLWCRYLNALWPHTQQHLLHFKSHLNNKTCQYNLLQRKKIITIFCSKL